MTHLVPKTLAAAAGLALTVGAVLTVPAAATAGTSAISLHRIKVGGMPDQVTIDHQTRSVWVAAGRLVRISEVTRRVTASITIRPGVRLVAADPKTRTVWAASCLAACSVVAVREATNRVAHRIGGFKNATGIGVDPRRGLVWVAALSPLNAPEVLAISEAKHRVVRTIALHADSHHQPGSLAVNPSTGTVWVAVIPADPSTTTAR